MYSCNDESAKDRGIYVIYLSQGSGFWTPDFRTQYFKYVSNETQF